jgi:glutathione S-transferase
VPASDSIPFPIPIPNRPHPGSGSGTTQIGYALRKLEESTMKYYYHPGSPNCRKVSALIEMLGAEADYVFVDLPKGDQAKPEFLAINPNGMVPALVDGDTTVLESNCILIHLAERTGSELWPETGRLEILRWMFWEQSHFMYATGMVFFQKLIKPLMGQETDEVRVEEAVAKFRRHAEALDRHLAEREWLVGDAMTLADLAVAGNLTYADACELPMDEFPNVQRWYAAISELDAWKATHPALAG